MQKGQKEWFRNWFDSPYYHILYRHRDEEEAEFFLDYLIDYLKIPPGAKILDMPCGKGRHAIYLSKKGFDVIGADLSKENISQASLLASENLHFYVHDMRQLLYSNYFGFVFNLFTSIGYFKWSHENLMVIKNIASSLKSGGILILDFLNAKKLLNAKQVEEQKLIDGIEFHISRSINDNQITKTIRFEALNTAYAFEENVSLLQESDFDSYFDQAGLIPIQKFGSYDLKSFNPESSDRLIYVVKKP